MRTWARARRRVTCGGCGEPIYPQQPVQEIRVAAVRRTLLRCLQCAGEPVPADLPVAPLVQPRKSLGVQSMRTMVLDWKQRQSGEGV